ncbi:hypothetical protein H6G93_26825 [Nostoc sp. FACHB-973]|nr:hypothetical protein [Nostoc sp. FACHB-973]
MGKPEIALTISRFMVQNFFQIMIQMTNIDLDEFGISIIQAGGAKSIPSLMKLLDEFGIKNIGLMDRDQESRYSDLIGLSFTQGQDFEEDIYESFSLIGYVKYLEQEFPNERKTNFFIGKAKSIGVPLDPQNLIYPQLELLSPDKIQELKDLSKEDILKSMRNSKSILDGGDLGNYVTSIPQVYKDLIQNAVNLSKNAGSIGTKPTIPEA